MNDENLTHDAFLGGRLHLWQPRKGYRAGVDPVLLAATIPAVSGQRVLELGCGVGAAILCLAARIPDLNLTGVERESAYAELAARNGAGALEVIHADIADLPLTLRQRQFDHVLANPPYWKRDSSVAAQDPTREVALGEQTPLSLWIKVAAKRLVPKGYMHIIHRAERLPDLLAALPKDMGSVEVLPIAGRAGRSAERVILRARKSGRADFRLHVPLVLHHGEGHLDGDQYVQSVREALRAGAALSF